MVALPTADDGRLGGTPARQKPAGLQNRLHGPKFRRYLACSDGDRPVNRRTSVLAQPLFRLDRFCRAGS
jgi:hypothetical protein